MTKTIERISDKQKCVNCGACAKVCPYTAIANRKRPCENACKIKAISMGENSAAHIDNSKCISCGACVYQCPFGAIMDKSFILDAIDIIKKSEENTNYKTFAVVAPSISSQFTYAKLGQVITGLKKRENPFLSNILQLPPWETGCVKSTESDQGRIFLLKENFIEGMACSGGCIGGAGCLTHGEKNKAEVDKYGKEAYEKTISDAVSILKKN